jgi:hypothetical protein
MKALYSMAAGLAALNLAVGLLTLVLPQQLSATTLLPLEGEAVFEEVSYPEHVYPGRPCSGCLLTHRLGACESVGQASSERRRQLPL